MDRWPGGQVDKLTWSRLVTDPQARSVVDRWPDLVDRWTGGQVDRLTWAGLVTDPPGPVFGGQVARLGSTPGRRLGRLLVRL